MGYRLTLIFRLKFGVERKREDRDVEDEGGERKIDVGDLAVYG